MEFPVTVGVTVLVDGHRYVTAPDTVCYCMARRHAVAHQLEIIVVPRRGVPTCAAVTAHLRHLLTSPVGTSLAHRPAKHPHARRLTTHGDKTRLESFEVGVNRNHPASSQLVTLAHEMAHIYLGHCGGDEKRGVRSNRPDDLALREVEAETVAYVVAKRTGVTPRSESYLDHYQGAFGQLDLHRILRVAGTVEKYLELPFHESRIFG